MRVRVWLRKAPRIQRPQAPVAFCASCRFWRPYKGWLFSGDHEPRHGLCGRHAPVLSTDPLASAGSQPETAASFWCGDWEAKKEQDHGNP